MSTHWLKRHRFILLLISLCAATACGGGAYSESATPAGAQAPPSAYGYENQSAAAAPDMASEEAGDFDMEMSEAPAPPPAQRAPSDRMESGSARASAPTTRPGLGTTWGENRSSRISRTTFDRADGDTPLKVAQLFYNDEQGIRAMARQGGAHDHGDGGFDALGGMAQIRLLDASGSALPTFDVASRRYVVGESGQRYVIEIRNNTGERLEAVATVDGLDVVDGLPGSFSKRGYVVAPFDTLRIEGFRRSTEEVATFRFGSVRDSYAAKKGKGRNVGVIGLALFHEVGSDLPWTFDETRRRHTADPFPSRFATPPSH